MKVTDIHERYPQGWFAICFSKDIATEQVLAKKLMGKELVLWRSSKGEVHLQDAYCPHLGTHLGHCGKVSGEKIQCPFHGLTFDGEGKCATSIKKVNDALARQIGLKTYPVIEQNGIIFSCFDSKAGFNKWEIESIDLSDYTYPKTAKFEIRSSPHEITENTVDLRHFNVLHKYCDPRMEYEAEGGYLQVRTFIKRDGKLFRKPGLVQITTVTHHYGLGYANVNITVPDLGLHFVGFVLPTPIDHHTIELRFKLSMKKIFNAGKVHPLLRFMSKKWVTQLVFWQSFRGFLMNVAEDVPIWQTKAYLSEPALSSLDEPIIFYRDWADQFYN